MTSPSVMWDGLELNPLIERNDGVLPVVEDVTGWYDTPDYNGNNTPLVLADGSVRGPKITTARDITISGSVTGPPPALALFRDQLVVRAAALLPADLTIPDAAGREMTASVRCDSTGLKHTFSGPNLFSYQTVMTAADPRLYGPPSSVTLSNFGSGQTGWAYTQSKTVNHWRPTVTAAAQATAYDWTMSLLAFQPGTTPSGYQFGYAVPAGLMLTVPLSGNFGHQAIDAGDTGLLVIVTDRPVSLTVSDTAGNQWALATMGRSGTCQQATFIAPNARALSSSAVITITANIQAQFMCAAYGLHGLGAYISSVSSIGNSTAPTATITMPVQSAPVISLIASGTTAPSNPAGWTSFGSNFGNGLNGVLSWNTLTAGPGAWPTQTTARLYPRLYAATFLPNTAILLNQGTVAAPVIATYEGDLSQSRLVDSATGDTINFAALTAGAEIALNTATLNAWADGGASRNGYVLPGSVPLLLPPGGSSSWELYASGSGSLTLTWSSAWQ